MTRKYERKRKGRRNSNGNVGKLACSSNKSQPKEKIRRTKKKALQENGGNLICWGKKIKEKIRSKKYKN